MNTVMQERSFLEELWDSSRTLSSHTATGHDTLIYEPGKSVWIGNILYQEGKETQVSVATYTR